MTDLHQRITQLPPEQRAALERKLLRKRSAVDGGRLRPRDRSIPCQPSFAQHRLWFHDQFIPDSPIYNIPLAMRITGSLNTEALRQALDAIVQRHEALRTTIGTDENREAVQTVNPNRSIGLVVHDMASATNDSSRPVQVEELLQNESRRPFNLKKDLMVRAMLVREANDRHVLLIVMHHIASDGWSCSIFARELRAYYDHFCTRGSSDAPLLPELPIQYADYAAWQRRWLSGEVLEQQLTYWRQQLAGAPTSLGLPTNRPRPHIQTFNGRHVQWMLPRQLTSRLHDLGQSERSTPFMTMLAAFNVLLSRYSGQEDIILGTPVAGRNEAESEQIIGLFVNALVVRTDLAGNPPFRQLLARVRGTVLAALSNQDVPFEKLVEQLDPQRNLSQSPIFQVSMAFQNIPRDAFDLGKLSVVPIDMHTNTSKLDMTLSVLENTDGTRAEIEYNTDLFDAETIEHMLRHYQTLLESIVADPDKPIRELAVLSDNDRRQLIVTWNDTARDMPGDLCVHDLVARQARRTPDAIAAVCGDTDLTYSQLNRRADQLAQHLQSLGAGPGKLVGICVSRSLQMLVGLLGILKSGAAYVPLDPAYPAQRLEYMLGDSGASVLLTEQSLLDDLPAYDGTIVCLDRDWPVIEAQPAQAMSGTLAGDDLAYVIYTSGSTGKPKGVMVRHGGLTNFLSSMGREPGIDAEDVLLAVTTFCFDIAALELYLPLTRGARVVIADHQTAADARRLAALLTDSGATVMQATPATWSMLVHCGWAGSRSLKILCGGEALPRQLADALLSRCDQLWNLYGPTETTIWSTLGRVESADQSAMIGRPIDNTRVYVLDSHHQPVPVGVPGELHIGGEGLAHGYFNMPQLTAERFVPDSFHGDTDAKMYKTGDLCRWRGDGALEFIGRNDHQVKVRGHRIELAEIESVLCQDLTVKQCVVVAVDRHDDPSDRQLVAYLTSKDDRQVPVDQLRTHLAAKLPDYMVPTLWVQLDTMPLTPNGKVDRAALPAPDTAGVDRKGRYVSPRTKIEQQLVDIWQQLLQAERIGIHDNFFELGGHSLLAVRLLAEIDERTGIDLALPVLFEAPTVAQLAEAMGHDTEPSTIVPLRAPQPGDTKPPLFCICGIFLYQPLAQSLEPSRPVYAIHIKAEVDLLRSHEQGDGQREFPSVEKLAAMYLKEILAIQPEGPYHLAGVSFGGLLAFEIAQQLRQLGKPTALLALFDTILPGAMTRNPLRRAGQHLSALARSGPKYAIERIRSRLARRRAAHDKAHNHGQSGADSNHQAAELAHLRQRNYLAAMRRYKPQPYPNPIMLFRANDRIMGAGTTVRPDLGWSPMIVSNLQVHDVPGTHIKMIDHPNVRVLADLMADGMNMGQGPTHRRDPKEIASSPNSAAQA